MKIWIIAAAVLVFAGNLTAYAQSGRNKGSGSTTTDSSNSRQMTDAPVGHRQPRASDVPDEKNLSDPNDSMSKEDTALDRKIKGICRGC